MCTAFLSEVKSCVQRAENRVNMFPINRRHGCYMSRTVNMRTTAITDLVSIAIEVNGVVEVGIGTIVGRIWWKLYVHMV
jgi:hypothetical protein